MLANLLALISLVSADYALDSFTNLLNIVQSDGQAVLTDILHNSTSFFENDNLRNYYFAGYSLVEAASSLTDFPPEAMGAYANYAQQTYDIVSALFMRLESLASSAEQVASPDWDARRSALQVVLMSNFDLEDEIFRAGGSNCTSWQDTYEGQAYNLLSSAISSGSILFSWTRGPAHTFAWYGCSPSTKSVSSSSSSSSSSNIPSSSSLSSSNSSPSTSTSTSTFNSSIDSSVSSTSILSPTSTSETTSSINSKDLKSTAPVVTKVSNSTSGSEALAESTTFTIESTSIETITSCAATVTDCPLRKHNGTVYITHVNTYTVVECTGNTFTLGSSSTAHTSGRQAASSGNPAGSNSYPVEELSTTVATVESNAAVLISGAGVAALFAGAMLL